MAADSHLDRVPVLMYHRVDVNMALKERTCCVSPRLFSYHLHWLADQGYVPCKISEFDRWFRGEGGLPARSVLITFDDGFAGLLRHALPLLAKRNWPATVFLVSGLIGQHDQWTTREFGAAGANALLDRSQIAEMVRHGIEFHSHSRMHSDLTQLDDAALEAEVRGSRVDLQQLLGTAVDYFAYPFGRFDHRVRAAVQAAGYRLAFSVNPGFNRPCSERLAVRRLDITGSVSRARFGRMVSMGTNDGSFAHHVRYLGRRALSRIGLAG